MWQRLQCSCEVTRSLLKAKIELLASTRLPAAKGEQERRLLPMLKSMRREAKSMAAFHFAMEAAIKKDQNKLDVFQVGVASSS
ncbi:hypothetical protein ANCDUO_07336 [Ancylostoma duodenale]|uniref:Uncharacterized protein n=1 Tax=Ancylostoma duodenale TaxID=51022 RepID=A0A0C2GME4_9BILA|nr:hypothetical protein ANCDUO_07336 [Ancylostoma duodenale]